MLNYNAANQVIVLIVLFSTTYNIIDNTLLIHQITVDKLHIFIFIIYYKRFILNQKLKYHSHIMHTRQSLNKLNTINYVILQDIFIYLNYNKFNLSLVKTHLYPVRNTSILQHILPILILNYEAIK